MERRSLSPNPAPYRGVRCAPSEAEVLRRRNHIFRRCKLYLGLEEVESMLLAYGRMAVLEAISIVADIERPIGKAEDGRDG